MGDGAALSGLGRRGPKALLTVLASAVLAGALIWYATPWGPWAASDSVSYVEAARNLAAGRGLVEITAAGRIIPFAKQPPLYPSLLAFATVLGADVVDAARWLDVGLFFALVLALAVAAKAFNCGQWTHVALPLVVVTSPVMILNYTGIMSEAVFLTLGMLGMILLVAYLRHPCSALLVASAASIGMAAMTRYAGISIIVGAILALGLFQTGSCKRRLLGMARFGVLSALPLFAWTVTRFLHSGIAATNPDAGIGVWALLQPFRRDLYAIFWSWVPFSERIPLRDFPMPPGKVQLAALVLVAFTGIALLVVAAKKRQNHDSNASQHSSALELATGFLLVSIVHVGFMALVSLLGPWDVGIDERQLSPVFLFGAAGVVIAIGAAVDKPAQAKVAAGAQLLMAAVIATSALPKVLAVLEDLHTHGSGYTGARWHNSPLVYAVAHLPADMVIISNDIEGIMFHTGRSAYRLPELQTRVPSPITEQFGSRTSDPLQRLFAEGRAVLVIFDAAKWRLAPMYGEETDTRLAALVRGLYLEGAFRDGDIYLYGALPP